MRHQYWCLGGSTICIPILRVVCFVLFYLEVDKIWSVPVACARRGTKSQPALSNLDRSRLGDKFLGRSIYLGMVVMVKTQLQVQPVFRCRLTSISLFCFYLSLSSSVDESLCVDEYGGLSCGHRHSIVFQRPLPGSNPGCCVWCPNFQSSAEISQEQVCSGHKIARSCHVNAVTWLLVSFKHRAFISQSRD